MTYQSGGKALASLSGTETVVVGNGGPQITTATTQQIADLASEVSNNIVITALNTVGAGTITAAGIVGGITSRGGAQTGTPFSDATDTAANIILALPAGAPVGTTFLWTYENTTNANATITAGLNVTLAGNVVVPLLTTATYLVNKTGATAVSITFVNGGSLIPLPVAQYLTGALQAATLTVGGITGSQVCNYDNTGTTPGNLNMPTAPQIIAAIPNAQIGFSYELYIRNSSGSANTATITTNTGVTLTGTMTIAQTVTRQFVVTITGAATVTVQSMGISAAGA